MSSLDDFIYSAVDLVTTSSAEGERNKYWDLMQLLSMYIFSQRLDLKIAALEDDFHSIHTTFQNNGCSNTGFFAAEFNNKEEQINDDADTFIAGLWDANNALIGQYNAAVEKYNYWREIAIQEDEARKEYAKKQAGV